MLISQAFAQSAAQPQQGGGWFLPIMMIGLLLFMYFTTIRPQRKRQKEHTEMVEGLRVGDEVMTSSGMLGKITSLEDHYMILNVAKNVDLKFQRIHANAVLPKGTLKSIS